MNSTNSPKLDLRTHSNFNHSAGSPFRPFQTCKAQNIPDLPLAQSKQKLTAYHSLEGSDCCPVSNQNISCTGFNEKGIPKVTVKNMKIGHTGLSLEKYVTCQKRDGIYTHTTFPSPRRNSV